MTRLMRKTRRRRRRRRRWTGRMGGGDLSRVDNKTRMNSTWRRSRTEINAELCRAKSSSLLFRATELELAKGPSRGVVFESGDKAA